MAYLTLQYDGNERAIEDWGVDIDSLVGSEANMRGHTLRFSATVDNLRSTPVFAKEGKIILRMNRISATGLVNSFSGGTIEFIGYRTGCFLSVASRSQRHNFQFQNWWYFAEKTIYQVKRASRPASAVDLAFPYTSDVSLFMELGANNEFVKITNGRQIENILNYLVASMTHATQGYASPLTVGAIAPALDLATYTVQEIFCSQALEKCLEMSPECTITTDYSADPPIVRVLSRNPAAAAHTTPVTLMLADKVTDEQLEIREADEAPHKSVIIYYKITATTNGISYYYYARDKYGAHGVDSSSDPDGGPHVLVLTQDLVGPSYSARSLESEILTRPCLAQDASEAARLAWWKLHNVEFLQTDKLIVDSISVAELNLADDPDTPFTNLDLYPNELVDGNVFDWMKDDDDNMVEAISILVQADVEFRIVHSAGEANAAVPVKKGLKTIYTRLKVTNGATGLYELDQLTPTSSGEAVPLGVARTVYEATRLPQFEGSNIRVDDLPRSNITLANNLNLSNGRPEWLTMKAQIQVIAKQYGRGRIILNIGAAKHVGARDLKAMASFNRLRRFENPAVRATAEA